MAASFGLMVSLCLSAALPAGARAAGHTFNPLLSLTGGTSVSKLDEVPDPSPHPPESFANVVGVAVDAFGNVYVDSYGSDSSGKEGRIDVFDAAGHFLTELKNEKGPGDIAVDSHGVLYVHQSGGAGEDAVVVRYTPSEYPPTASTSYTGPVVVDPEIGGQGIAVNRANDHLLLAKNERIVEYGSATEGNPLLRKFGEGNFEDASGIAVSAATGDVFVGALKKTAKTTTENLANVVYVFAADGTLKTIIDGADTPAGTFKSSSGRLYPAIDETTGEVFVNDIVGSSRVYRFVAAGGKYEYAADPELEKHSFEEFARIAVANAPGRSNNRNVYVTSGNTPPHLFAFAPELEVGAPIISATGFTGVTTTEADLFATVDPNGAATSYHFEYVDEAHYVENGFAQATTSPAQPLPAGHQAVEVSIHLSGLTPGTTYHFRLVASNNCKPNTPEVVCVSEGETEKGVEVPHAFATFAAPPNPGSCPNQAFRVGPSALLPDCRAYELVSPVNTGGRPTIATPLGSIGNGFNTPLVSADGESVVFETFGGAIPGFGGNGVSDRYRSIRSASGWTTDTESPSSSQTEVPGSGGVSADHGYSFWLTGGGKGTPDAGSLVLGKETTYLRTPSGSFELLGEGNLGIDPEAVGRWISPGGNHVIFTSAKELEVGAPVEGKLGIYDRRGPGQTEVLSLLPNGSTPPASASIFYEGTSADGTVVAFAVEESGVKTHYLRIDDATTIPVETGAVSFAGLSADGETLTYAKGGDIFSFDVATQETLPVGSGGKSTVVNVSADGSRVYFVSPEELAVPVLLENGLPASGQDNLYVWTVTTGEVNFVATVTPADVEGETNPYSPTKLNGLGLWTSAAVAPDQNVEVAAGNDSSRTSSDGRYLVFQSDAKLTGYDANGSQEIYRYDAVTGSLLCVSCPPDLSPASSSAVLQGIMPGLASTDPTAPTNSFSLISNVTSDGRMVFFESEDALVPTDVNGVRDVYEWESQGTGGCAQVRGCVSLISYGRGAQGSFLYGVSSDGRDVFFTTVDALVDVPGAGGTPAIYDARVNGGFATASPPPGCQLGGCQESGSPPQPPGTPASSTVEGPGKVRQAHRRPKRCRRNQRGVRRHGKVRCVPKHAHKRHKGGSK